MKLDPDNASPIPLTQARVRLFHLVDEVLSGASSRLVLSHRDRGANVILIAQAELEKLERELAAFRARAQASPLRGLGQLNAPVDDVLGAIRGNQSGLAATKVAEFGEGNAKPKAVKSARAAEGRPADYRARRKKT
ncbi:MAG: hypothetical protein ABI442_10130 [Gemmatimonadaceae bacterium]